MAPGTFRVPQVKELRGKGTDARDLELYQASSSKRHQAALDHTDLRLLSELSDKNRKRA